MKILIILITLILSLDAQNIGESVYKNIILKDIKEANHHLDKLEKLVDKNSSDRVLKSGFIDLMMSWKKVQTLYMAADLDEDYIDIPRYIDMFHQGKEDITKQLDHILASADSVDVALFKNSTKSLNALEYLLFKPSSNKKRQKEMVLFILKHIGKYFKEIEHFYHDNKSLFMEDAQKINAIIMNALIESSYKLKSATSTLSAEAKI